MPAVAPMVANLGPFPPAPSGVPANAAGELTSMTPPQVRTGATNVNQNVAWHYDTFDPPPTIAGTQYTPPCQPCRTPIA